MCADGVQVRDLTGGFVGVPRFADPRVDARRRPPDHRPRGPINLDGRRIVRDLKAGPPSRRKSFQRQRELNVTQAHSLATQQRPRQAGELHSD